VEKWNRALSTFAPLWRGTVSLFGGLASSVSRAWGKWVGRRILYLLGRTAFVGTSSERKGGGKVLRVLSGR